MVKHNDSFSLDECLAWAQEQRSKLGSSPDDFGVWVEYAHICGVCYHRALVEVLDGKLPTSIQEELFVLYKQTATQLIEKFPENGTAYWILGHALLARSAELKLLQGESENESLFPMTKEVQSLFQRSADLSPKSGHGNSMLPCHYESLGDFEKARLEAETAFERNAMTKAELNEFLKRLR